MEIFAHTLNQGTCPEAPRVLTSRWTPSDHTFDVSGDQPLLCAGFLRQFDRSRSDLRLPELSGIPRSATVDYSDFRSSIHVVTDWDELLRVARRDHVFVDVGVLVGRLDCVFVRNEPRAVRIPLGH